MTSLLTRDPGHQPLPRTAEHRVVGEIAVVRPAGDLDLAAVEPVTNAVRAALAERPIGLVLDLADVTFADTVGLRVLLWAMAEARAQGCGPALAAATPAVAALVRQVGLDAKLPAYADASDAIEGLMLSAAWR